MNKIRTSILTAALAGGSILGLAGVTGIADAATDTAASPTAAAIGDTGGIDVDDIERAQRRAARLAAREAFRTEIADLLGVSADDLHQQLQDGATLADVAEANGVAVTDVVDLIVQQKTERIGEAVESGRLTAEEAAEKTADLDERVQTGIEEGRTERGDGDGRRGGGQRGGDNTDASDEAEAEAGAEAEADSEG